MPKEKRQIQKKDIMPLEHYTKQRKELRKKLLILKRIEEFHWDHMQHSILRL